MLHPHVGEIVAHIRRREMPAGVLTNGLLLSPRMIDLLNQAGLDHLQISIDNVTANEVTRKHLQALEKRLRDLTRFAQFDVNVNTVIGADVPNPADAWTITLRAAQLGFSHTLGLVHDAEGALKGLSGRHRRVFERVQALPCSPFQAAGIASFQRRLVQGLPNSWHCPAGNRYLYICENGWVHYCSQRRGCPGIPLEDYTREVMVLEGERAKQCAPFCTISCVHRVAWLDRLRTDPWSALAEVYPAPEGRPWQPDLLPASVRRLADLFAPRPDGTLPPASRWIRGRLNTSRFGGLNGRPNPFGFGEGRVPPATAELRVANVFGMRYFGNSQRSSAGKTAWYLTLCRGSAIIGATVSRQSR